jgi:hypothetical protein
MGGGGGGIGESRESKMIPVRIPANRFGGAYLRERDGSCWCDLGLALPACSIPLWDGTFPNDGGRSP